MNNKLPDEVVNTSTELALALGNPFATEAGFNREGSWYIWGGIPDPEPGKKWKLHTGFMLFEHEGMIKVAAGKRKDLEPLFCCGDFDAAIQHVVERCGKIKSLH
jgi:hypothetical protein